MNKEKDNQSDKKIPYNPNRKMSDDDINSLLDMAASQVNGDMKRENIQLKEKEEEKWRDKKNIIRPEKEIRAKK